MLKCASIGGHLRQVRLDRGLSRNAARQQLGYSNATYARIEAGISLPQPVELPAIAIWLLDEPAGMRFEDQPWKLQPIIAELRAQLQIERNARRTASAPAPAIGPGAEGADERHATEPSTAGDA